MTSDYSIPGKVKITMANYIRDVLEGCTDITGTADSPAHSNLFTVRPTLISPLLGDHSIAAQLP